MQTLALNALAPESGRNLTFGFNFNETFRDCSSPSHLDEFRDICFHKY